MDDLFANEASVTPEDQQELREALLYAYPDFDFLYMRLADRLGIRANQYFDLHRGFVPIARDIVEFAAGEGKFLNLLAATWTDKPGNPKLAALANRLLPDKVGVTARFAPPPPPPAANAPARPSLEKAIEQRSRELDIDAVVEGLEALSKAICRISAPTLKGTGFLVGRRHVLTNFHVMEEAIGGSLDGESILLQFDYRGGGSPTFSPKVAPGLDWKRQSSRYSLSDLKGVGEPSPQELDFALVKLAEDVPAERHQLAWPLTPPIVSQRDLILIGQHPRGDAAKIAYGEVLAYPGSGLRYRYDATTDGGSSGSPVLTLDFQLVGLHHAADPGFDPKYNQGVPIWLIMAALKADGVDLGAL